MATNLLPLFLLLLIAVTATARPCKTIFYLSSSTTTTTTYFPNSQNPSHVTLIFTTVTTRFRNPISDDQQQSSRVTSSPGSSSSILPLKLYSSVSSSIGERSKDIMSVVGALLFGVGCGALTAATMFFIWALCSPRGYEFDDEDEEEETKAMGYVTIDDDLEKKNKGVV